MRDIPELWLYGFLATMVVLIAANVVLITRKHRKTAAVGFLLTALLVHVAAGLLLVTYEDTYSHERNAGPIWSLASMMPNERVVFVVDIAIPPSSLAIAVLLVGLEFFWVLRSRRASRVV